MRGFRVIVAVLGAVFLLLGLRLILTTVDSGSYPNLVAWLLAAVLLHDFVLVPLITLLGLVLTKLIPAPLRAPVQGGLVVGGVLTLIAIPVIVSSRIDHGNSSLLPQNYVLNLVVLLVTVTVVTFALVLGRRLRNRQQGEQLPH